MHVALQAHVICQGRGQVGGIEDRVAYLLVGGIGRVGQVDMLSAWSMAALAANPGGKCLRKHVSLAKHVAASWDIRVGVVAEETFSRDLTTKALVVGMVEAR